MRRGFTLNQPSQIDHISQPNCNAVQRINLQQIDSLNRLNVQCCSLAFPGHGGCSSSWPDAQKDAPVTNIDPGATAPFMIFSSGSPEPLLARLLPNVHFASADPTRSFLPLTIQLSAPRGKQRPTPPRWQLTSIHPSH